MNIKKSIPIISSLILIIIVIVLILFLHSNDDDKTKEEKLSPQAERALQIVIMNNSSIKKEDLEYVKKDKDEKHVFKIKNEETYYYVDLKTNTFTYSEY